MAKPKEIQIGQLYEIVTNDFFTSGKHRPSNKPQHIPKGQIIQIRFPYKWHFRTTDQRYYHATPETIESNCQLIGKVYANIRWNNFTTLEEILILKLYTKVSMAVHGAESVTN